METATMLEHKLTEEKIARLEAENRAHKLHEESNKAMKDLREKLNRAEEELKKKNENCIIL